MASFPCPDCKKPFNSRETLKKHKNQAHNTVTYTCEICHKTIKVVGKKAHMAKHKSVTERPKFYCDVCNKLFMSKIAMQNHRISIHMDPKDWPFQCPDCDRRLPNKGRLMIHQQSHSQDNYCAICEKSFRSKQNLQVHMNLHTGARPYICKVCSKAFNDRSGLHSHLKKHEAAMGVKLILTPEEARLAKIGLLDHNLD